MIPIVNLTKTNEENRYDGIKKFSDIIGEKYAKLLNVDHINFDDYTPEKKKGFLSFFE